MLTTTQAWWLAAGVAALVIILVVLLVVLLKSSENVAFVVRDEMGVVIQGAAVAFTAQGDTSATGGFTDSDGVLRTDLAPGKYTVTVNAGTGLADPTTYAEGTAMVTVVSKDGDKKDQAATQTFNLVLEGWSKTAPLPEIHDAVRALATGPATATLSYSYVPGGRAVVTGEAATTKSFAYSWEGASGDLDASMTEADFIGSGTGEIELALLQLKALLEAVFQPPYTAHPLTVVLERREEGVSKALDVHYTPEQGAAWGLGAIRIAMAPIAGVVLAYAWTPAQTNPSAEPHAKQSDIVLSSLVDWRRDANMTDTSNTDLGGGNGGYSAQAVVLHEMLHSIGLGHHVLPASIMFFSASHQTSLHALFQGGSVTNSVYERAALRGLYTL